MDGLFDDLIPTAGAKQSGGGDLFGDLIPPPAPVDARQQEGEELADGEHPLFNDLVPKAPEPSEDDHGVWSELKAGSMAGLRGIAESAVQTAQLATGKKIDNAAPVAEDQKPFAAPFDVGTMPDKNTAGRVAYHLAQGLTGSAPEMAGGMVGGAAGAATPIPGGTFIGAGLGAGAVYAFRQVAPHFAAELQAAPDDPDGAWTRALKKTGIGTAGTAAAFAAFGINPFSGELKNLAFQAFGLQPAVAVAEHAATNKLEGKAAGEGVGSTYIESALGTVGPYAAMRPFHGRGSEAAPATPSTGEPAEAPPRTEKPATDGNFASPVPEFIKGAEPPPDDNGGAAGAKAPPGTPKVFKIDDPEAYGLDLKGMAPEHAEKAVAAAQDTEAAAAALRTAMADPGLVDPALAAQHPIPEFNHENKDGTPSKSPQRGVEGGLEPAPPGGSEGARIEPREPRQAGDGLAPADSQGVRGPAAAPAEGESVGGGRGRDAQAAGAEPARVGAAVKPAAPPPENSQTPVTDRSKFRRDISRATGQKGVPVFDHGDGAAYDPLLGHVTVGEDVTPHPAAARAIGELAKDPVSTKWRETSVEAALEDGGTATTTAGHAADALGARIRRAMEIMQCLG